MGTGTSFNVSSYPGYKNFTTANFICEPVNISKYVSVSFSHDGDSGGTSGTAYNNASYSFNKTYNASSGVLTITSRLSSTVDYSKTAGSDPRVNVTGTMHVYLVQ